MKQDSSRACHRCFKDKALIDLIRAEGQRGWCNWCGARNVFVIPLDELGDIFRDVVSTYKPAGYSLDSISFLLQEDWEVFNDKIEQEPDLMQQMTVAILKDGLDPKDYYSGDYPDFNEGFRHQESWLVDHWQEKAETYFADREQDVKHAPSSTSILGDTLGDFPDHLEVAFEDLLVTYDPGKMLYRARIHKDRFQHDRFALSDMGAPPYNKARAGRANKKNEPVLYLANNAETALAEVRAWKGMTVAVSKFEVVKPLSVVSLQHYMLPKSPFFQEYLKWKLQLAALFDRLVDELSRPVLGSEDEKMYFSTQYLCDLVRKAGYDGIEYPSAMGGGFNVVFFNTEVAKPLDITYSRITRIKHSVTELKNNESMYDEGPFDYLFERK